MRRTVHAGNSLAYADRMNEPIPIPKEQATTSLDAQSTARDDSGFYPAYADFSRNVRTWFLAFGVGAPVLLLTNKDAGNKLVECGAAETVAFAFLIGVAAQVIGAILYKTAMWYLYTGELEANKKGSRIYKVSEWLSDQYWIEFALDAATFFLFSWASFRVVRVLVA